MTVNEYITDFNLEHDHAYSNASLLKWINILEANLDVIKDYRVVNYSRTVGENEFDLPEGVPFEDVYRILWVDGVKYKKMDPREYQKSRTFWYEGEKLCIYPIPTVTDTEAKVRLVYQYRPAKKLIANIATDDLYIPEKYIEIYDFFLLSKIAYLQKEYGEHANHMVMFNQKVSEFETWWENNRPSNPESEMTSDEYYESTDFDRS